MKRLLIAVLVLFFTLPSAIAQDIYPFSNKQQRQLFQSLTHDFRCLVCQNEDLASSNAALAADLRKEVYNRVLQNQSRQQIVDYMVARYGNFVLFKPPFTAATYALWFAPFILLLGGVVVWYLVLSNRKG